LRSGLQNKGFEVKGVSQIIPLIFGDTLRTQKFADKLQEKNYWVLPIRPPTVPKNESRLRFSLTVHHSEEILQKLIDDLAKIKI
jgi:8-amino-7-oxononanoate synthase